MAKGVAIVDTDRKTLHVNSTWCDITGYAVGDVVGRAANVSLGRIAVGKNGDWEAAGCGVVFASERIATGVYAAAADACDAVAKPCG